MLSKSPRWPLASILCGLLACLFATAGEAATFTGNADLTISDNNQNLTWNTSANALTVQCWFKLSIPSGTNLAQDMVILVNRTTGTESDGNPSAFLLRFNINNGCVEFLSQGRSGNYTNTLIQQPYLERWYHLAVVRQSSLFTGYVDGLQVFNAAASVGDSSTSEGISIGGWNGADFLYGEVQEVSIYQNALAQDFIAQNMYNSQPTNDPSTGLSGYYPIGFATNQSFSLANQAPGSTASAASIQGAGTVSFPETDQAGEQSAFDAWRNGGRNSVVPLSGAFSWQQVLLARPTPGIAFDLRMEYSSANTSSGAQLGSINPYSQGILGNGWRHSFQTALIPAQQFSPMENTDVVGLMRWDGSIETWNFDYDTDQYATRDGEYNGELVEGVTNWTWTTPDRLVYTFYPPDRGPNYVLYGRLLGIKDFNGNSVQLHWNPTSGVLTQIVDSVGGVYDLYYHSGLLTNISFNAWAINFAYDSSNHLISKMLTNTSGACAGVNTIWQFRYDTNGLLSQIIDPRGMTNITAQYDQYNRLTNQIDALNRATATIYGGPGQFEITHLDPATNAWVETYDRKGNVVSQADPLGNTTRYTYDTNNNRLSVTEPLGWTTWFSYDARANVVAQSNALNQVTTWVYHPFFNKPIQQIDAAGWTNFFVLDDKSGNLLQHYDKIGTLVSYTYLGNGLVNTSTDANSNTTQFRYDTNGFLVEKIDPATNTTSYSVNDVGWKLGQTNALGQVTSYVLDLNGKIIQTTDPLQRIYTNSYDAAGNLLSASDGKGQLTTYYYDAANQRTQMVDRAGFKWNYVYSSRGKLLQTTDPLTNTTLNSYDAANRLVAVTDPLGLSTSNIFDANGNLTTLVDKAGQRWTKGYDALNRVVSEIDPLKNWKQTAYDAVGRLSTVTSPNGYLSTNTYDGRGRLVQWLDPQNYTWLYDYDGVGNITNITDANGGHYVMMYSNRNERILERNQDGFAWQYTYDELLRLRQQTDPNGLQRLPGYDAAGRLTNVNFSTGRHDLFAYDANDNLKTLQRSSGGVTTSTGFSYDSLDRIIEQDDALGKSVLYGYDPMGRQTSITYPGNKTLTNGYDALGRLISQTDWAGRQMTYTFDPADRLISRTYPNGIVQSNAFDSAGRLAALAYSPVSGHSNSINIALTYAYDRNGNKTGSAEKGTLAWPPPSLTDETSQVTASGRLASRQIQNVASNQPSSISYHYDASGNLTNATGPGETWSLSYDEDNRTTSINWDCGLTSKNITNRYDALGRRISETVDGTTTGYVLSLAGGMERTLCDLDGDGNVLAYYVHGPDLCYKIDATNGLVCYHADAQGNIIALTDGNATLLAQYAYTPYGRSLGSTNFQSQISNPYLFVGSQGVMEELPGLYFMRARYFSADTGAFLSTDPTKNIGPTWRSSAYTYSSSNPIKYSDPNGQFFVEDDLWYLGIGASVGLLDTAEHDVVAWKFSGLKEYVGSAWGGAIGMDLYMNTLEVTHNAYIAGYVGGAGGAFAHDTLKVGLNNLTGTPDDTTLLDVSKHAIIAGWEGVYTSYLSDNLRIPNVNGGVIGEIVRNELYNTLPNVANTLMDGPPQPNTLSSGSRPSSAGNGGGLLCSYTASTVAPHGSMMSAISSTPPAPPAGPMCTVTGSSNSSSASASRDQNQHSTTAQDTGTQSSPSNSSPSVWSAVWNAVSNWFSAHL